MLCENCKKNEATVYITETVNGHRERQHLCANCVSKAGIITSNIHSPFFGPELSLGNLLSTMLGATNNYVDTKQHPANEVRCDNCGMTYYDFMQKGKFGCSECFNNYGDLLDDSLKRIHGSDRHIGKKPKNYVADIVFKDGKEDMSEVDKLQAELNQAIKDERYEDAARLRDNIRDLRKEEGEEKE